MLRLDKKRKVLTTAPTMTQKIVMGLGLTVMGSVVIAGIMAVMGLIFALPVMWLWNACLAPNVDFVSPIGFWSAWGIFLLSGLLFKSSASTTSGNKSST